VARPTDTGNRTRHAGVEHEMDRTGQRALVRAVLVVSVAVVLVGCGGSGPAWWGLRAEVGPESTVIPIGVRVGSSSCNRYEGVTIVETDESVTITAHVVEIGRRSCTDDVRGEQVEVPLERPLGDRELKGCAHTDRRPCNEVAG
jgi:hypothetical protein